MTKAEFVARVESLGAVQGTAGAERAVHAVLGALGAVLQPDERRQVEDALPEALRGTLGRSTSGSRPSLDAFYDDTARREDVRKTLAVEHAQIVCRTLLESAPDELGELLRKHLPELAEALFTPRPPPPPVTVVERTGSVGPSQQNLARGRPGSRHPISEARPVREHTHSIASSSDPHGDTKLSSAKGMTQEREEESLATGKPRGKS